MKLRSAVSRWALALVLSPATGVTLAAAAPARPNILWLITEDMGPELGCYGTPEVATPVLDDLAARGMRFTRAFTVTPVCSTSRSSFCTGMYASTIGAHQHRTPDENKQPLPAGVKPVSHWLRDAGYYTANMRGGTTLNQPGKVDWNFKFEGKPFVGSDWSELKGHQPFYAQINHSQSHRGWGAPEHADPNKVRMPPYYADHPLARKDWAQYLDEITEVDGLIGGVLERLKQEGMADNTIIFMFGDHGRAHFRGKQWPYDSGLSIPLIIYVPPALQKLEGFRPGTVSDRLVESLDLTATTLALAGLEKPAKMQGRVLFGAQAEPEPEYVFGIRDRCDMTTFHIRTVRDTHYRYIRNFMPDRPFFNLNLYKERSYPMIALMRGLHEQGKLTPVQDRFFEMTRPAEELYFIADDPYEIRNLASAADPAHQHALKRLRARLDQWIVESQDQGQQLEDPAVGLEIFRDTLNKSTRAQLEETLAVIGQQRRSPGISDYYAGYLNQVEKLVRAALENEGASNPGETRRKKRKK